MNFRKAQLTLMGTTAVVGGLALFGTQGCTVEITEGDGSFDGSLFDSSKPDAYTPPPANTCDSCLFAGCTNEYALCQNDRDCRDIYTCTVQKNCTDTACFDSCRVGKPMDSRLRYFSLAQCNKDAFCSVCSDECTTTASNTGTYTCTVPDGGSAPDATPDATPDAGGRVSCDQCAATSCSTERGKCGSGSDCANYVECVGTCANAPDSEIGSCLEGCDLAFPTGETDSQALSDCLKTNCTAACTAPVPAQ